MQARNGQASRFEPSSTTVHPMPFAETLLVAVGLAMDSFAVALGASAQGSIQRRRTAAAMVFWFGTFQGGMAVVGWLVGARVSDWITTLDHWIAFGLLAAVGAHMIRGGVTGDAEPIDLSGPWTLLSLAVATSIDALAVGLGMAFVDIDARGPGVTIAVVTAALTLVGVLGGRALGRALGDRMQIVGGVVLFLIGARILVTHLTA